MGTGNHVELVMDGTDQPWHKLEPGLIILKDGFDGV